MPKIVRPIVNESFLEEAIVIVRTELQKAREKHGKGSFLSWHEIFGTISEEYHELLSEIQKETDERRNELVDIAIVAIWGLASSLSKNLIDEKNLPKEPEKTVLYWRWFHPEKTWEVKLPVNFKEKNGFWNIWLVESTLSCDKGRWIARVAGMGGCESPDDEQGFPRYFFSLQAAKIEMAEWVNIRQEIIKPLA